MVYSSLLTLVLVTWLVLMIGMWAEMKAFCELKFCGYPVILLLLSCNCYSGTRIQYGIHNNTWSTSSVRKSGNKYSWKLWRCWGCLMQYNFRKVYLYSLKLHKHHWKLDIMFYFTDEEIRMSGGSNLFLCFLYGHIAEKRQM